MTTARLRSEGIGGEASWTASMPDTSADRWKQEAVDDLHILGSIPNQVPVVSFVSLVRSPVRLPSSMLVDYYSRIFVIPEIIDVRNPKIGQAQPYKIWNAYLEPNTLQSIIEIDADGLTNSAVPPVVFKATQLLDFSITVDSDAPIVVDASFEFVFDDGSGILIFRAERAVLLGKKPDFPFVQELLYDTDILRSYNGTEQRISIRPTPRQVLSGKIVYENDAQIRDLKAQLFIGVVSPIIVPLWHEPFLITSDADIDTDLLDGDFSIADWLINDFLFIESRNETIGELVQISAATDSLVTLKNVLTNSYPAGSIVYPTVTCSLNDGSGFGRYPINAAEMKISAKSFGRRLLGGKTASLDTHNSLTLLDRRSLNDSLVSESFLLNSETIDYGGAIQIDFAQDFSKAARKIEFLIPDRIDLQFWKLLLDTLVGRREPFYTPTFREDLVVHTQPDVGGSSFLIPDSPNYVTDWWPSTGHRDIVITNQDGDRLYRTITGAVDNGDGTITITLGIALPGTAGGSTIVFIEFLELVRLASDVVSLSHYGQYSTITMSITTTKE